MEGTDRYYADDHEYGTDDHDLGISMPVLNLAHGLRQEEQRCDKEQNADGAQIVIELPSRIGRLNCCRAVSCCHAATQTLEWRKKISQAVDGKTQRERTNERKSIRRPEQGPYGEEGK